MNPRIADLLRHDRQLLRDTARRRLPFRQIAAIISAFGKLLPPASRTSWQSLRPCAVRRCRPAPRRNRQIGSRHHRHAAVIPVIHHRQPAPGVLPQKQRRQLARRRAAIHANVQERHSMCRQRRNQSARVPRHVGHLRARRHFAEPLVQRLRQPEAPSISDDPSSPSAT